MKKWRRCLPMFGNNQQGPYFNYGYSGQMMNMNSPGLNWNAGQNQIQRFPYQSLPQQNFQMPPFQQQNPYFQGGYQPMNQAYSTNYVQQPTPQPYPQQQDAQFLFHNPLQPQEDMFQSQNHYQNQFQPMNGYPMMNPYPKQNMFQKQPGGLQSFMNSFKSQDGSVDFSKMVNTAGQMMNAVNQVSSLVKGLGGIFKV